MKYDPTGQYIITCAAEDKEVKAWLPRREGLVLLFKLYHDSHVSTIQWCCMLGKGDDKKLMMASGCANGKVQVWSVPQILSTESQMSPVNPSYSHLIQDDDEPLKGTKLHFTLSGHLVEVTSLAFSPNALMIVTGCAKGWLKVWSLVDGSLLQTYIGNGSVRSTCWYADHGLATCFNRTKDVIVVHYPPDVMEKNQVLARARTSLRNMRIEGLHQTPCFKTLLQNLPNILLEQYQVEKVSFFSSYMKYRKVPKFSDARKIAVTYLKFKQSGQTLRVFCQNDAYGIANREDPDQTAPLGAV